MVLLLSDAQLPMDDVLTSNTKHLADLEVNKRSLEVDEFSQRPRLEQDGGDPD